MEHSIPRCLNIYVYYKAYSSAEGDVGGLSRRALLIEEEVERSEERLAKAVTELARHSQRADSAIKKRQQLLQSTRVYINWSFTPKQFALC